MRDVGYYLRFVNIALEIVLIILLVYAIYVGWIFFGAFGNQDADESIVLICNSLSEMDSEYAFCCEKRDVFIDGGIVELSCFDLDRGDFLEKIVSFDCSGVSCGGENLGTSSLPVMVE